jgi:hypothetical protein
VAVLIFCLAPLTWIASGLVAGWLAARRGKSWCWGFALGFFFSTAGVAVAALPRRSGWRTLRKGASSGDAGAAWAVTFEGAATPATDAHANDVCESETPPAQIRESTESGHLARVLSTHERVAFTSGRLPGPD